MDEGFIIKDMIKTVRGPVNDSLSNFWFQKGSAKTTYNRSFNKLDNFFSYVGGLIGVVLSAMLIMNKFSELSFEINIGKRFFTYNQEEDTDLSFSILHYLPYLVYTVISFFGKG